MKLLDRFKKRPEVAAKALRSQAATEFFYLWRGTQMENCEIMKQPCMYTKSMVVLQGHRRMPSPVCPGCIFMHSAAGVMDLADHLSLEEGFANEEEDEEPEAEEEL